MIQLVPEDRRTFRNFQEIWGNMVRAVHTYNGEEILRIMADKGFTHREVAAACGVSERHIGDIVNGRTAAARSKSRKKFIDGFVKLGLTLEEASTIFR